MFGQFREKGLRRHAQKSLDGERVKERVKNLEFVVRLASIYMPHFGQEAFNAGELLSIRPATMWKNKDKGGKGERDMRIEMVEEREQTCRIAKGARRRSLKMKIQRTSTRQLRLYLTDVMRNRAFAQPQNKTKPQTEM